MARRKIDRTFAPGGAPAERKAAFSFPAIGSRIRFSREKAGKEQKQLAAEIGVTGNAVSNWENGRSRPDLALIPALCRALDISFGDLFGTEVSAPLRTAAENRLLEQYRRLTPGHQAALEQLAEALLGAQAEEKTPNIRRLIHFGKSLSAGPGDPTEFDEQGTPLYLYATRQTEKADCVFTVNGDSMEPAFHNGDAVLISRIPDAPALQYGEVGAFIAGNETYIKVYEKDGLHSLNPAYAPMRFGEGTDVYLIGRVVGVLDPQDIAAEADTVRFPAQQPAALSV